MNFESLPEHIQRFITEGGMRDRVVGVAQICGDASDRDAVDRYLSPQTSNIPLSHYTSWERLEGIFDRQSLCMKRVDQFAGDTKDGTYPQANESAHSAMDSELFEQFPAVQNNMDVIASHEASRTRSFAHCWFEGWEESPNMWRDYGDRGTGVCILTRSHVLFSAVNQTSDEFHMLLGGCFYRNDDEAIPSSIGSMPLFCKRREFSSENEVRLVAQIREGSFNREANVLEWIPIRTMDFIERLVLGPKMPAELADIVRTKIKQMLPNTAVLSPRTVASEIR